MYWRSSEKFRDGTQNDIDKGVTLCFTHHRNLHDAVDRELDDYCHEYLDFYYNYYE